MEIVFWGVLALSAVIMLIFYSRSGRPFRTALKGMLSGTALLLAVSFFGDYIGISLPLNSFTASVALVLGAPGVVLLVAGRFFL